jgi:hypothetical protein
VRSTRSAPTRLKAAGKPHNVPPAPGPIGDTGPGPR